jgi:hypothetical protein
VPTPHVKKGLSGPRISKAVDLQKLSRFDLESGSLCGLIEMEGRANGKILLSVGARARYD